MALDELKNALAGRKVLIVDDDPETMLFVVRTLQDHGMATRLVTSQREGFDLLNDEKTRSGIGLVIVDLQFIGQELPADLLTARQALGRNATANNTGQALGYWLWRKKMVPGNSRHWPRYVYASISPSFWKEAEVHTEQELKDKTGKRSTEEIRATFVLGKLVRDGEEFCEALETAWTAWSPLETATETAKP
ncbi:MAG: response regulator [Candidatus Accumulibacter sp.]|nr:response regulator [Accumulibacter sp.]